VDKVVSVILLACSRRGLYISLFIYPCSVTASTQGIHLVVALEEETLDEETGTAICVNPEWASSHESRSAKTYGGIGPNVVSIYIYILIKL
jgi:hypothetical protein